MVDTEAFNKQGNYGGLKTPPVPEREMWCPLCESFHGSPGRCTETRQCWQCFLAVIEADKRQGNLF